MTLLRFENDMDGTHISVVLPNSSTPDDRWCMILDSMVENQNSDGNVDGTCLIYAKLTDEWGVASANQARFNFEQLFTAAQNAASTNNFTMKISDYYDDGDRVAMLLGGGIVPAGERGWGEFTGKTIYRLSWTRSNWWEGGPGTQVPETATFVTGVAQSIPLSSSEFGRIYRLESRTKREDSTYDDGYKNYIPGISKYWAGVKLSHFDRYPPSNVLAWYDSKFNFTRLASGFIREANTYIENTAGTTITGYYQSQLYNIVMEFSQHRERGLRFFAAMKYWNNYLWSNANAHEHMTGRYRVLIRYAIRGRDTNNERIEYRPDIDTVEFVLRPVTLWRNRWTIKQGDAGYLFGEMPRNYINEPSRHWIVPSHWRGRYQVTDIGEITIGQDMWGRHFADRTNVGESFCFGIEAEQVGDNRAGVDHWNLIIDSIVLMPAENMIYLEFEAEDPREDMTASCRVNVINERSGLTTAHITNVSSNDVVQRTASLIDNQNWGIVPYSAKGHTLVIAFDTEQPDTHSLNSVDGLRVAAYFKPRSQGYISV